MRIKIVNQNKSINTYFIELDKKHSLQFSLSSINSL